MGHAGELVVLRTSVCEHLIERRVNDATIADNDITWRAVHARKRTGTVNGTPANRYQFLATGIGAQTDFFGFGSLTWLTGANQARQVRVESDDGSGSIELMDEMLFDIADGDTFEITAGCRKRIVEDCRDKHENTHNARYRILTPCSSMYVLAS